MLKLTVTDALQSLGEKRADFARFIEKETFDVSLCKPERIDPQSPHARDELYAIVSRMGEFFCNGETTSVAAGDALFVAAGIVHRFENFTGDFAAWVIFYGSRPTH